MQKLQRNTKQPQRDSYRHAKWPQSDVKQLSRDAQNSQRDAKNDHIDAKWPPGRPEVYSDAKQQWWDMKLQRSAKQSQADSPNNYSDTNTKQRDTKLP